MPSWRSRRTPDRERIEPRVPTAPSVRVPDRANSAGLGGAPSGCLGHGQTHPGGMPAVPRQQRAEPASPCPRRTVSAGVTRSAAFGPLRPLAGSACIVPVTGGVASLAPPANSWHPCGMLRPRAARVQGILAPATANRRGLHGMLHEPGGSATPCAFGPPRSATSDGVGAFRSGEDSRQVV